MNPACLDDATLDDFVNARLSGERLIVTEAHLDTCQECSAIVNVLAGGELALARAGAVQTKEVSRDKQDDDTLANGTKVGRHLILEPLGRGAMGVVYLAYDPELDRKVALKLVRSPLAHARGPHAIAKAPEAQKRMLREAQAMAQVSDPNVVAIYDVGRFGDSVYFAMEFVEGTTLREWLSLSSEESHRGWDDVRDVFLQAGRGLVAAHDAGLVHRDFKPENVLVGRDRRVRVTDFGLARVDLAGDPKKEETSASSALSSSPASTSTSGALSDATTTTTTGLHAGPSLTRTGTLLGTPSYMALEVLAGGEATMASDQFSFAVALYEAVFGRRPFVASSIEGLRAAIARGPSFERLERGPAERRRDAVAHKQGTADSPHAQRRGARTNKTSAQEPPHEIRRVLARALSVRPEDRYPTMRVLLAALAPEGGAAATRSRALRPAIVFASLGLAAALAATLTYAAAHRSGGGLATADLPCASSDAMVKRVLDVDRIARVKLAFAATGLPHASSAALQVLAQLGAYANELATARRATCEATEVRHEQSPALLDARMHCLQRRVDELDALTTQLEHATPETVARAADAASSLPRIDACADVASLQAMAPRPSGDLGKKLIDLEARLAISRVGLTSGALGWRDAGAGVAGVPAEGAQAIGDAKVLVTEAEAIGYRPVVAETRLLLATLLRRSGAYAEAAREANESLITAEAAHDDRGAALAWLEILALRGEEGSWTTTIMIAPAAIGAIARLGSGNGKSGNITSGGANGNANANRNANANANADLEASVLFAVGVARTNRGDLEDAERDLNACLEQRRRVLDAKHLDIGRALTAVANVARAKGDLGRALALHQEALALDTSILGANHPGLARHFHNIAGVRRLEGKLDDAEKDYERALVLEQQGFGPRHRSVGRTENSLGLVWLERRDAPRAREHLDRALDILVAHPDRALTLHNLGLVAAMEEKHAEAIGRFDASLSVHQSSVGAASAGGANEAIATVLLSRSRSERALGDLKKSRATRDEALAIAKKRANESSVAKQLVAEIESSAAPASVGSKPSAPTAPTTSLLKAAPSPPPPPPPASNAPNPTATATTPKPRPNQGSYAPAESWDTNHR